MEKETFIFVRGYEGYYEVGTQGTVRSVDRIVEMRNRWGGLTQRRYKGCVLKPKLQNSGYLFVELKKNNKGENKLIHRLVAEAFIPNPNNYPEVNHKDECKLNNKVSNLEWCDRDYNLRYGTRVERGAKTQGFEVEQYSFDGKLIATYYSAKEAARQTGYGQGNISACCRGEYKQAYGYIWKYKRVSVD